MAEDKKDIEKMSNSKTKLETRTMKEWASMFKISNFILTGTLQRNRITEKEKVTEKQFQTAIDKFLKYTPNGKRR